MARQVADLLRRSFREFREDHCQQMAAAISYHLLFSLVPLMFVAVGVIGLITQDPNTRDAVTNAVLKVVPLSSDGQAQFYSLLKGLGGAASALGLLGVAGLLWSASGVMSAIRVGLNMAWDTDKRRPFVRGKLIDLLLVAGSFIVVGATLGATLLTHLIRQGSASLPQPLAPVVGVAADAATFLVATALLFGTFLFLYRFVPSVPTRVRGIWPGALVAALGFEAVQQGFAVYVAHFSHYQSQVYGFLGAVLVFLLFVYLASVVFLFGAEVASEYPRMRAGHRRGGDGSGPPPDASHAPAPPRVHRSRLR